MTYGEMIAQAISQTVTNQIIKTKGKITLPLQFTTLITHMN